MPHITVQMYTGRSTDQKTELSRRLAEIAAEVLGVSQKYVSVSIYDVEEADWERKVYDQMIRQREHLFKTPEYGD